MISSNPFFGGQAEILFKERNSNYQNHYSAEKFRQTNEKYSIELRKIKRNNNLQKRRTLVSVPYLAKIFAESFRGNIDVSLLPINLIKNYPELAQDSTSNLDKMLILRNILQENSPTDLIIESLEALQGILIQENEMNTEVFIRLDLVQLILKLIDWKFGSRVVLPAISCIHNLTLAVPYYIRILFSLGTVEALFKILSSNSLSVSALALASIGNICISVEEKLELFKNDLALTKLENLINENQEMNIDLYGSMLFYITQVVSKPGLAISEPEISLFLKWVEKLVKLEEPEVMKGAVTALFHLSLKNPGCINRPWVRSYLCRNYMQLYSLRAIINLVYYSDELAFYFIENLIIEKLSESLLTSSRDYKKHSITCLNNLFTSGNNSALINEKIQPLFVKLLLDSDQKIRKETVYFLSNLARFISLENWAKMIDNDLYDGLIRCLDPEEEMEIIDSALKIAASILLLGAADASQNNLIRNKFVEEFTAYGIFDSINDLLTFPNDEISNTAEDIIEEFFEEAVLSLTNREVNRFEFS